VAQVKAMVVEEEEVVVVAVEASVEVTVETAPAALEVAQGHSNSHRKIRDPRLALQEELDKEPGSHQDPLRHPEEIHPRRMNS
jgi:hypothetical protein